MPVVKLKDIAKECGYSISTVSRILSGATFRKDGDPTSVRVFEAAQKLGFIPRIERIPQTFLRTVQRPEPYSIGCILTSEYETFVSPFFSRLLASIQKEFSAYDEALNYNLVVSNIKDPGFSRFITADTLDCAIILGRTSIENIEMLKKVIPAVIYAGVNTIKCGIDEVICDSYAAATTAVEYLVSLGHTEIGYIGPTQQKIKVANEHRFEGFLNGLKNCGLSLNQSFVSEAVLTTAAGYESAGMMAHSGALPSAVFCANDTVALGAMRAFIDEGLKIPEDISLIGFDNIDMASYVTPALTTISIPSDALAHFAVKTLLDKIQQPRNFPVSIHIPYELVERESCRKI